MPADYRVFHDVGERDVREVSSPFLRLQVFLVVCRSCFEGTVFSQFTCAQSDRFRLTDIRAKDLPDERLQYASNANFQNLFQTWVKQFCDCSTQTGTDDRPDELPDSWLAAVVTATTNHTGSLADTARINVVKTLIAGIRSVSVERDRNEILRWYIYVRQVLGNADLTRADAAKQLYRSINTLRVGQLVTNIAATGLRNYKASRLPLALKIALPVTAVGTAIVGAQGAGIAALAVPLVPQLRCCCFLALQARRRLSRRLLVIAVFATHLLDCRCRSWHLRHREEPGRNCWPPCVPIHDSIAHRRLGRRTATPRVSVSNGSNCF